MVLSYVFIIIPTTRHYGENYSFSHTHTDKFSCHGHKQKKNLKHRVFIKIYYILLGRRDCMAAKRKRKEQMR